MSNKKKTIYIWSIVGAAAVAVIFFLVSSNSKPGEFDEFAQCLKDKGAVFYGAFWCPHCKNQKEMFGKSAKFLPYVECSTSDGKSQLTVCKEKNVSGYPTWEFADESRESGEVSMQKLSEKTGCEITQ